MIQLALVMISWLDSSFFRGRHGQHFNLNGRDILRRTNTPSRVSTASQGRCYSVSNLHGKTQNSGVFLWSWHLQRMLRRTHKLSYLQANDTVFCFNRSGPFMAGKAKNTPHFLGRVSGVRDMVHPRRS